MIPALIGCYIVGCFWWIFTNYAEMAYNHDRKWVHKAHRSAMLLVAFPIWPLLILGYLILSANNAFWKIVYSLRKETP